MRKVVVETADGLKLPGHLYEHETANAVTVLHGATGVPFRYYEPFAKWYSEETSRHILIYEYRDTGELTNAEIKASKVTMADWGISDQSAALDFAIHTFPDLDVHTIGHSLGGFCIPFHANADKIKTHTGVNAGLAYWRKHPWSFMPQVVLFWFILGPLATKVLGYLPGVLLGMKSNLPPNVYWQWRKWCTNPNLHQIEWGTVLPTPDLEKFQGKLTIIATEDDNIIPKERIFILDCFFPKASVEKRLISPSEYGIKSIGHIGIFAERNKSAWAAIIG